MRCFVDFVAESTRSILLCCVGCWGFFFFFLVFVLYAFIFQIIRTVWAHTFVALTIEINYTQCQYCVTCKSRAFHAATCQTGEKPNKYISLKNNRNVLLLLLFFFFALYYLPLSIFIKCQPTINRSESKRRKHIEQIGARQRASQNLRRPAKKNYYDPKVANMVKYVRSRNITYASGRATVQQQCIRLISTWDYFAGSPRIIYRTSRIKNWYIREVT